MENFKEKINEYIEKNKKNSKINQTESKEVCLLIKENLSENTISIDEVVDTLINLHYTVTANFMKTVFINLENHVKDEFIKKFLNSDKIVKNANSFGIKRILYILNILIKEDGNEKFIHYLLKNSARKACSKKAEKKSGELLLNIVLKENKNGLFLLDYSDWNETELKNLFIWLDKSISSLSKEIDKILNEKNNLHREIKKIKKRLTDEIKDKENLTVQLSEERKKNNQLEEQIKTYKAHICDREKKLTEMDERLKDAYTVDKRAEKQEIAALKNSIVKQLKSEYEDFQKLASKNPEEYHKYYKGLILITQHIFDSLRRNGITIKNENEG